MKKLNKILQKLTFARPENRAAIEYWDQKMQFPMNGKLFLHTRLLPPNCWTEDFLWLLEYFRMIRKLLNLRAR